jgi:hypothetical protein
LTGWSRSDVQRHIGICCVSGAASERKSERHCAERNKDEGRYFHVFLCGVGDRVSVIERLDWHARLFNPLAVHKNPFELNGC